MLLAWLRSALHSPPPFSIDVVFFDLEELGRLGSRAYVECFSPESMLGMINLDMCGVGDTLLVAPSQSLLKVKPGGPCSYRVVDSLPAGDALSFEQVGVPTLSACILPAEDVEPLRETVKAIHQGQRPTTVPKIFETFHNGFRDSIETIEEAAMQKVLNWLETIIKQF